MYTNASSLPNKMSELRDRVENSDYDIVAVTETWANEQVTDAELTMSGFSAYRKDRVGAKGGGLIIYINNRLRGWINEDLTDSPFKESLWCNVQLKQQLLLVGLCYRSPTSSSTNNELLLQLLEKAVLQNNPDHMLIMGDFNYPQIDYETETTTASDNDPSTLFLHKSQELCLFQHVHQSTRMRTDQEPSTLDYVFTDEENIIERITHESPLGKSDHTVLCWDLFLEVEDIESVLVKFDYSKGNYTEIQKYLLAVNWRERWRDAKIEDMWTDFTQILKEQVDRNVPLKKLKKKRKKRFSKHIRKKIQQRVKAWKKYCQFRSSRNYEKYKEIRNEVNRMISEEDKSKRKQILSGFKRNPKKFYGYMRNVQTVKDNVMALKQENGDFTTSDQETANLLATHFQEVYTTEDISCIPAATACDCEWECSNLSFSPEAVRRKLEKLQTDKSPGPDDIHPHLLNACAEAVAEPLSLIFQESYQTGILPAQWKSANIVPIFKKGNRSDPANYRPISLTAVPCKIMESIIKEQLTKYLEFNDLLSEHQHGFARGRSCLTNLLETFENWTEALDQGYGLDIIYLDYRKAFDSVPHRRLMAKLQSFGIKGRLLQWLENFLVSRTMRVGVRGTFSSRRTVQSGVPQGSVLGPLLFLLFVNELPSWITCQIKMFADDTKIWCKIEQQSDSTNLQKDLDKLNQWSHTWQLSFNPEKCKVMHIGHPYRTEYFMTEGPTRKKLESAEEERDLGVIVRSDLKSASQCTKAATSARKIIGMVRRHFKRLDIQDFNLIYKTYIRPHVEFCIQAWSPHLVKDIQLLENVQKAATNLVPELRKFSYEERLRKLGLTSLKDRRERGDMIEVYKLLSRKEQIDSNQFFTVATNHHGLRGHDKKIVKERCRLDIRKFFFSQRVVNRWNKLPVEVVDAPSVNAFKNAYDRYYAREMDTRS